MASERLRNVLQHVRRLATGGEARRSPDRELLTRFVQQRDEAAFTALVQRHAPMVLGVCRRVLRHSHDAEDAAQATFLVLAYNAKSIEKRGSLGSWLHTVAYRAARKLQADILRRTGCERSLADVSTAEATQEVTWREVQLVLDEELNRLPEKYRAPLVLCFLEGMTQDEAARQLGWSREVLRGRVDRGRKRLRCLLVRRGVTFSAAMLGTAMAGGASAGMASPAFVDYTVKAAALVAAGQAAAQGAIPAEVAALAGEVSRAMFTIKLRAAVLALLVVGILSGFFGFHTFAGQRAADKPAQANPAQQDDAAKKSKPADAMTDLRVITDLKEIGEAVEPDDTVNIIPGMTRILVLKEKPARIALSGNDQVATYNLIGESGRQLSFLGRRKGSAVAYLWFGNEKARERQSILSLRLEVTPFGVDEERQEPKQEPRKPSKKFNKYVQQIIDPKEIIRIHVGQSRLFILKEMPKRIQVVDDTIATFELVADKQFMLEAKKAGETIVSLWFHEAVGGGIKESVYSTFVWVEADP
jgi:RNA polymerase sigma factor (sigma-70 family)